MPNAETFTIPAIGSFVQRYLVGSKVSIDPFARNKRWATYTNDLNPETEAEYHMECEDFLKMLVNRNVEADLVIMDPPYSPRQIKECYDNIGIKMEQMEAMRGATLSRRRALINQLVSPGGVVLTFGWNTNGMGKHGWKIEEIMLVAHGSDHNDTICMAERRVSQQLQLC
jgi:tRNA1(Val) A37 N6-methylase TrmN6